MEEQHKAALWVAGLRGLHFALRHPYATTGIFGAAVGSAVTYTVLTTQSPLHKVNEILTPKVYEIALSREDLHKLMLDPNAELRWEGTTASVIMTSEKREPLKQLPIIDAS
jgi:hypothetical protein